MNDPHGSPSSGQRATRVLSWPSSCCGTHKSKSHFFSPRKPRERPLPHGALSAAARMGRSSCKTLSVEAVAKSGAQVVFLSTPHEASLELVPQLLAANPALRIVDLSGAYRFRDPETFANWYKLAAPDRERSAEAVYGLPELYADALPGARLVANPGCYPTSVILGLRPLVEAGWINTARGIVCDCKSGVSGAGKEPKRETQFVEVNENFRAYGLFTHRHTPEVSDHLGLALKNFVFTTHLLPVERGILSTLYMWLNPASQGG